MADSSKDLVRAQFGRQAGEYAQSASHARGDDLRMLVERLPLGPGVRVLDVATGTGNTAFAAAESGARVTGLDLTAEMLAHARRQARERGLDNVSFVEGDAEQMPFGDGSFDVVTARRAPHHFTSIARFLREARRVLREGGALGIVDQVSPEAPSGYELMERLEKLRDPSHARALRASEWHRFVVEAGFELNGLLVREETWAVDEWLRLAGVASDQERVVRAAIESAEGDAARAIHLVRRDGGWCFAKRYVVLWATAG